MKSAPATKARIAGNVALAIAVVASFAPRTDARQAPPQRRTVPAAARTQQSVVNTTDPSMRNAPLIDAAQGVPAPNYDAEAKPPAVPPPTDPFEPYLINKQAGPFMVHAHTFRGPDATKFAVSLVKELRGKDRLPAYIFFLKIHPNNSNIMGVPPTAPREIGEGRLAAPEGFRVYDEASVLVGHCKSIDEAKALLKVVKKISPACLKEMPTFFKWRRGDGLSRAYITQNPYVSAQDLYPGKPMVLRAGAKVDPHTLMAGFEKKKADPMTLEMNSGPNSVYKCPGDYTLTVASFAGRSGFKHENPDFRTDDALKKSPLMTALDDAEELADALNRSPELRKAGARAYTFHDNTSSIVTVGSFGQPNDPKADEIRQVILKLAIDVKEKKSVFAKARIFEVKQQVKKLAPLAPAPTLIGVPRP